MNRLLLVPLALACLLAGLLPLGVAAVAGAHGIAAGLRDPVPAQVLRVSVLLACAAAVPGAALGLAGAACLRHAGSRSRVLPAWVLGCAIAVLALPASELPAFPAWPPGSPRDLEGFGSAIARSAALLLLVSAGGMARLDPALRRAAQAAGATPFQAWRHAVLAPLALPAAIGLCLAFLAALAQTRAGEILAPHLDLAEAWALPAALLLVACSTLWLSALLRLGPDPPRD